MENLAFFRETKITCKVKKNLRAPPNNSLLQRPNDGRVHCRNAWGGSYTHTVTCILALNKYYDNNIKVLCFKHVLNSQSITNRYNLVNISEKLHISFAIVQTVPTEAVYVGECCFQVQTSELGHRGNPQDTQRIQVLWFGNNNKIVFIYF